MYRLLFYLIQSISPGVVRTEFAARLRKADDVEAVQNSMGDVSVYVEIILVGSTVMCQVVAWPSGLRRWFKAPVISMAWVRIPLLPLILLCYRILALTSFLMFLFVDTRE